MEKFFFFFYTLLSVILYLFALPFLLLFSLKSKYKASIPARFFLWRNPPLKPNGIWFHCCSFGEAKAIKPIVDAVDNDLLRMTTTTNTGLEGVESYTSQSRYLAFEPLLFGWLKPQKALIVMEAEFWYLLFVLAKKRGAKTLLINARMSEESFPKYLKMAWFYRYIFAHIDEVYAQTHVDKERLEKLGASNVMVTGDIKLSKLPSPSKKLPKPLVLLVCGASTHEGEEEIVLDAFKDLKKQNKEAKLLLVPRHPERFDKVALMVEKFAKENNILSHCYSQQEHLKSDIVVVDVLGELVNLYAISDIVIMGGSFMPIGGHNAAEAAQFGCKMISGKYYFNLKDIFKAVEEIEIVEASHLGYTLVNHHHLKPTKIKYKTDLSPILNSIEDVL